MICSHRIPALLLLLLAGCQSPPTTPPVAAQNESSPSGVGQAGMAATPTALKFSGGDGSSQEQAVIVVAPSEGLGVRAEYAWLRAHHPGCKLRTQSLVHHGGKSYDVMAIEMPNGDKLTVHFDISLFFGKL